MKKPFFVLFVSLFSCAVAIAQTPAPEASPKPVKTITVAENKETLSPAPKTAAKRGPVFRPTKDQIKQVQAMLKEKALYKGEATGTYNDDTRDGIKSFQKDNGLKQTGTLNRATLEKMGIQLTDPQKAMPVSDNSFAPAESKDKPAKSDKPAASSGEKPANTSIFRATSDQIKEAQKALKSGSMYSGETTGKLDDATRNGLTKYQSANGLKATGKLNQATLEKMGIALTDKQKEQQGSK